MVKRFLTISIFLATITQAGTIISTNLPSNTIIVNIDATRDGAAAYDVSQANWYQPFSSGTLASYTFQPGTYSFRLVNPTDAASLFPSLTGPQLAQIYTAWTYNSPWLTDWVAFDTAALSDGNRPQLISGAVTPTSGGSGYSNAATAYSTAVSLGFYNQVQTGPRNRTTAGSTTFTFSQATTLYFVIPDYYTADNTGGVSIAISKVTAPPSPSSVPEPATFGLIAGALGTLGISRRLRK